ncbi:hypothetical protein B0I35DRAFT_443332 [Stachybotrys elegans]|uniref:Uncharacterized protein n=1 Tax=Stachybotrys elegans TaxID=80388 RepID=A0A8K0WM86_9HYPO|nr:hypothetical protein B0I35DRAFT_443332 [Stachybotrys elegans]
MVFGQLNYHPPPNSRASDNTYTDATAVPGGREDEFLQTEQFVRLCLTIWLRRKTPAQSRAQVKAFVDDLIQTFKTDRATKKFATTWRFDSVKAELSSLIRPGKIFRDATHGGGLPPITLASTDMSWTSQIKQAEVATWTATKNVGMTWVAMARTADIINMRMHAGEAPPSHCDCSDTQTSTIQHSCSRCGTMTKRAVLLKHPAV